MSLIDDISGYSNLTLAFLAEYFANEVKLAEQIDPHLLRSVEILRDFCLRGGKAISPFLFSQAYKIGGGTKAEVDLLPIAGAIELHHKYLLSMDDIADRDETRYGGPTLEYVYRAELPNIDLEHRARSLAMLDAAFLNGLSKKLLFTAKFDPSDLVASHQVMEQTMLAETLAGWKIHLYQNVESLATSSPEAFIKGLELVTARYKFSGPFHIGLILAQNHSPELSQVLETYAKHVGTAFQVHDDILGLFGETAKTGKPVGNDIREGKKTLLVQIAYQKSDKQDQDFLTKTVGKTDLSEAELTQVQRIVIDSGSLTYSKNLETEMARLGIAALEALPTSKEKQNLIDLANFVISREK